MPGVHEPPLHRGDAIRGDAALAGEFLNGVLNGDDGSRGADHRVPAVGAVHVLDHLELLASRVLGIHHVASLNAAVGEVLRRHRHAAHVQALHEPGLELAAQDQFGAAAADIGHEARVVVVLVGVRHTEVDEPRFLAPADDLDAMPQRLSSARSMKSWLSRALRSVLVPTMRMFSAGRCRMRCASRFRQSSARAAAPAESVPEALSPSAKRTISLCRSTTCSRPSWS